MHGARGHVLLQLDPGRADEASAYVAAIPSVIAVTATSGPYDLIATVQGSTDDALHRAVARARRTPGLCALRLCVVPDRRVPV